MHRDLPLLAEATGHLEPWRQVDLGVEVPGTVTGRVVEEGQRVAAGDLLLRLDDREHRIELEEATAELLKSRANYAVFTALRKEPGPVAAGKGGSAEDPAQVEQEYRRALELFDEGLISEAELDRLRRRHEVTEMLAGEHQSEVQAATTGLAQAEQRLDRARLALERTRLKAPFAGRVADVEVEVGRQLRGGERCLSLLDDSRVKVRVDVLEADVVHLRPGAPARVRVPALQDEVFGGRIISINPRVDPETGTGRATVAVDNTRGALIPGLFAFVELETRRLPDRLVVPASAVLVRQGRELVFRVVDGRAVWTYVETGIRSGGWVAIEEGLAEGDLVAASGHFALAHEAPVRVTVLDTARGSG